MADEPFIAELFGRAIEEGNVLGDGLLDGAAPVRESKDSAGHEHKGKGPGGGQFTAASAALAAAHPFPGPAPKTPPGTMRPDLVAKDPALAAAARAEREHAAAHNRAYIASTVKRLLSEGPPKLQPPPDPAEGLKKLKARGRRAKEEADAADVDRVMLAHAGFAKHQEAVAASHPEGKAMLEAARQVAETHYREAKGREEEYRAAVRALRPVREPKDNLPPAPPPG